MRIDAKDINAIHKQFWTEWSEGRIFNKRSRRDDLGLNEIETEMFYGYRGLITQYDPEMAKALLRTKHAQGKVSDRLFEAIMGARGEGDVGIIEVLDGVAQDDDVPF